MHLKTGPRRERGWQHCACSIHASGIKYTGVAKRFMRRPQKPDRRGRLRRGFDSHLPYHHCRCSQVATARASDARSCRRREGSIPSIGIQTGLAKRPKALDLKSSSRRGQPGFKSLTRYFLIKLWTMQKVCKTHELYMLASSLINEDNAQEMQ